MEINFYHLYMNKYNNHKKYRQYVSKKNIFKHLVSKNRPFFGTKIKARIFD